MTDDINPDDEVKLFLDSNDAVVIKQSQQVATDDIENGLVFFLIFSFAVTVIAWMTV